MGQSLTYATTGPVPADTRKAIEAEAKRLNRGRAWWCENLIFFKRRGHADRLTGDTKLFLGLGDELLDDEEENAAAEIDFDDDQFMAFYDARFILLTLADWSLRYRASWSVEMGGVEVASINGGRVEPTNIFEADAPAGQVLADDDRARAIHAKYAGRGA